MSLIFAKTRRGGGPCTFSTAIQQVYGQGQTAQLTTSFGPSTAKGISKADKLAEAAGVAGAVYGAGFRS